MTSHQADESDPQLTDVFQHFSGSKKKLLDAVLRVQLNCLEPLLSLLDKDDVCSALLSLREEDSSDPKTVLKNEVMARLDSTKKAVHRQHMKIVFFGRTSSGKSTLINAILGRKILPSDPGHSTNCFIQLQGNSDGDAKLYQNKDGSEVPLPLEDIKKIGSALCCGNLASNSILKLFYPNNLCTLLKEDIVLLDTPGLDVDPELDSWISTHCSDCDVFILLVNSESTISKTDIDFFRALCANLGLSCLRASRFFLVFNRWDAVVENALDDDKELAEVVIQSVREQHKERVRKQLGELLCESDHSEDPLEDKVFFLSAKKALLSRKSSRMGGGASIGSNSVSLDLTSSIVPEFEKFLVQLMDCTSRTAVDRKIKTHIDSVIDGIHWSMQVIDNLLRWSKILEREMVNNLERSKLFSEDIRDAVLGIVSEELLSLDTALTQAIWQEFIDDVVKKLEPFGAKEEGEESKENEQKEATPKPSGEKEEVEESEIEKLKQKLTEHLIHKLNETFPKSRLSSTIQKSYFKAQKKMVTVVCNMIDLNRPHFEEPHDINEETWNEVLEHMQIPRIPVSLSWDTLLHKMITGKRPDFNIFDIDVSDLIPFLNPKSGERDFIHFVSAGVLGALSVLGRYVRPMIFGFVGAVGSVVIIGGQLWSYKYGDAWCLNVKFRHLVKPKLIATKNDFCSVMLKLFENELMDFVCKLSLEVQLFLRMDERESGLARVTKLQCELSQIREAFQAEHDRLVH